jgi:hypothetical protein
VPRTSARVACRLFELSARESPDRFQIPMFLPLLLLILALLAASVGAYGTAPELAYFSHGLDIIYFSRRMQWPLFTFALVMCLALLAVTISGKRRAWWLLGLAPILALFAHRFSTNPFGQLRVADNPPTVPADQADFISDSDYVVGLHLDGDSFAYPYKQLFLNPAVVQLDFDKKFLLMWSAYANRATAVRVDLEYRARDLEIVSMPANALLLYNTRYGQFINGVTGETSNHELPYAFHRAIPTIKMTWKAWREANPNTKVMMPLRPDVANLPAVPILPRYRMPAATQPSGAELDAEARITFIPGQSPIALLSQTIPSRPMNLDAGTTPVLVYRDPHSGELRAFDRKIDLDLFPKFVAANDPKKPNVFMTDVDTNTGWSASGVAVEGDAKHKGQRLTAIAADSDVYWGVMKYWYPQLELVEIPAEPVVQPAPAPEAPRHVTRRRRTRTQAR